jgi:hypothetical protein
LEFEEWMEKRTPQMSALWLEQLMMETTTTAVEVKRGEQMRQKACAWQPGRDGQLEWQRECCE